MATTNDNTRNALAYVELQSTEVAGVKATLTVVSLDFGPLDYLRFFV